MYPGVGAFVLIRPAQTFYERILIDEGRLKEPVGVQISTAVIIAELIALFVVGFAISEHFYAGGHGHSLDILSVSTLIGQIVGFAVVTWFVSTRLLPKVIVLLHHFLQVPQLSFGLLLGGLFLVVVDQGKLAGIVSISMLRYLPRSEWERTPLSRVLRQNTPYAFSDELVEDALQRVTENSLTVLPVADKETKELIGSISSHEVLEMVVLTAQGHEI